MPTNRDDCPKWAEELIVKVRLMETDLGNLPPTNPDKWQADLGDIAKRVLEGETDHRLTEEAVEALFTKIVRGLADEGFEAETIAAFINDRVVPGARLKYCDANEVREAMGPRPVE